MEPEIEAVRRALLARLTRLLRDGAERTLADELDEIAQRCARLPVQDRRTANEILGYDESGPPS